MRIAGGIVAGSGAGAARTRTAAAGALVMAYLEPGEPPAVEGGAAAGSRPIQQVAARRRRAPGAHPCRDRAPSRHRGPVPDRRHLPRHPARALSARHRARASGSGRRAAAPDCAAHRHDQARPGPWRRQPQEHPARSRRARSSSMRSAPGTAIPPFDLAFCLNHLLLKCLWTPRGRARASLGCFDALAQSYLGRRRLGAAGRARGPRGRPAARAVPGPDRRQVAGRICDRRWPTRSGCAGSPAPS